MRSCFLRVSQSRAVKATWNPNLRFCSPCFFTITYSFRSTMAPLSFSSALLVVMSLLAGSSHAFSPFPSLGRSSCTTQRHTSATTTTPVAHQQPLRMSDPWSGTDPATSSTASTEEQMSELDKAPVEAGSHDELMYALGCNLARQLGM